MQATECALCGLSLNTRSVVDEDKTFCCHGCQAVYSILLQRGELDRSRSSPLFQQAVRSGIISNPELLEELRAKEEKAGLEKQKLYLEITDLWCPSCAQVIQWVLLQTKGVAQCVVDYATDLASIDYHPLIIGQEALLERVQSLGYHASSIEDKEEHRVPRTLYFRLFLAAFCAMNIMMFSYPVYASYFDGDSSGFLDLFSWLCFLLAIPVATYCLYPLFRRFLTALTVGFFGMETLVVIAVLSSFTFSTIQLFQGGSRIYFDSMAVIVAFVLTGKVIESRAKFSAKQALFRLSRALPRRGRKRFENGEERFVPLKEIQRGDRVIALTGEKIVLDGEVLEGEASIDESLMTGESIPVAKKECDGVISGSVVKGGRVVYRVTSTAEQSVLQQIISQVEQDIGHKANQIPLVDRIAQRFVPIVLVIALLSTAWVLLSGGASEEAFLRLCSVLLISCPCAIGIAAPLAESHLLNALASRGAIVRNRGCLPFLGNEELFVFDKTGTVTEGRFRVLKGMESLSKEQESLLKSLASQSVHPISLAIAAAIEASQVKLEQLEEHAGRGLRGIHENRELLLGSRAFLEASGVKGLPKRDVPETVVYYAQDRECIAEIILGDAIKPEIKEVISSMEVKTLLLSGDGEGAVKAVAEACRFDSWKAGATPLQKREVIEQEKLRGRVVGMIGDGINDAPSLTAAHVGISVVNATEVSIQVSDILLTGDHLKVIPQIRWLARSGRKIIRQNLFWAFFYNCIGIGLAVFGALSPLYSAFAMIVSSLIVILNSSRTCLPSRTNH